jgi:hypothetical protein
MVVNTKKRCKVKNNKVLSFEQKMAVKIHDAIVKEFSDVECIPKVSENWEKEILDGKHNWYEDTHKRYFKIAVKTLRAIHELTGLDIVEILSKKIEIEE